MQRIDYTLIEDMVPAGATVLDLACGDGELLERLIQDKGVTGSGVEIRQEAVEACIGRAFRCSTATWTAASPTTRTRPSTSSS